MKYVATILSLGALALALGGCPAKTHSNKDNGYTSSSEEQDPYSVAPKAVRPVQPGRKSIAFIIDTSGSMDDELNGERKVESAKKSLLEILKTYKEHDDKNNDIEAGLLCFKGGPFGAEVETLVPLGDFNYGLLSSKVKELGTYGGTPLGQSLAIAERMLDGKATGAKSVVMLTDGMNTAGWKPDGVYREIQKHNLKAGDSPTTLYLIAFDTDKDNFLGLEKLGARVYGAKDSKELSEVLKGNTSLILEEMPVYKTK